MIVLINFSEQRRFTEVQKCTSSSLNCAVEDLSNQEDEVELVGVERERSQVYIYNKQKNPSEMSMVDVGWRVVYMCPSSQCKSQLGFAWSFKV